MHALSCPKLPLPWLCAVGFCCWKLTPNVFSCVKKPDLAWTCLLSTSRKQPHVVRLGNQGQMAISQTPKNMCLEVASWQCIFYSGMELQPQYLFALECHASPFPPRPLIWLRWLKPSAAKCSLGPVVCRDFCCLNITPSMFSCVQKPDFTWKGLLFTSGKQKHIAS